MFSLIGPAIQYDDRKVELNWSYTNPYVAAEAEMRFDKKYLVTSCDLNIHLSDSDEKILVDFDALNGVTRFLPNSLVYRITSL